MFPYNGNMENEKIEIKISYYLIICIFNFVVLTLWAFRMETPTEVIIHVTLLYAMLSTSIKKVFVKREENKKFNNRYLNFWFIFVLLHVTASNIL